MDALLLVDIQNDFLPGGALAVPHGDAIIPVVNALIPYFDLVVASKDWHPRGHKSFASEHDKEVGEVIDLHGLSQIMWPDHCVQNSFGSEFPKTLNKDQIDRIIYKGEDPEVDSYSAFFDNGKKHATGLLDYLKEKGVDHVYIAGLATDYCVKFTAIDAAESGLKTTLIQDACKGVNLNPRDVENALNEMQEKGVRLVSSGDVKDFKHQ